MIMFMTDYENEHRLLTQFNNRRPKLVAPPLFDNVGMMSCYDDE